MHTSTSANGRHRCRVWSSSHTMEHGNPVWVATSKKNEDKQPAQVLQVFDEGLKTWNLIEKIHGYFGH